MGPHLDLRCLPYVLYGVTKKKPVSLGSTVVATYSASTLPYAWIVRNILTECPVRTVQALRAAAAAAAKQKRPLLPCFIFDPSTFGATTEHGNAKTGGYRAQFVIESVRDLRQRCVPSRLCESYQNTARKSCILAKHTAVYQQT